MYLSNGQILHVKNVKVDDEGIAALAKMHLQTGEAMGTYTVKFIQDSHSKV